MPQDLRIEVVEGIVRAEVSGTFDLDSAKAYFVRILEHARHQGVGMVLIDVRSLEGEISTLARFEFGSFMSEARPAPMRIAFVGSEEAVWPDRFVEAVAVNRGVSAKVTTDERQAIEWLRHAQSRAGREGRGSW